MALSLTFHNFIWIKFSYVIIWAAWIMRLDRLVSVSDSSKIGVFRKAVHAHNMKQIKPVYGIW